MRWEFRPRWLPFSFSNSSLFCQLARFQLFRPARCLSQPQVLALLLSFCVEPSVLPVLCGLGFSIHPPLPVRRSCRLNFEFSGRLLRCHSVSVRKPWLFCLVLPSLRAPGSRMARASSRSKYVLCCLVPRPFCFFSKRSMLPILLADGCVLTCGAHLEREVVFRMEPCFHAGLCCFPVACLLSAQRCCPWFAD